MPAAEKRVKTQIRYSPHALLCGKGVLCPLRKSPEHHQQRTHSDCVQMATIGEGKAVTVIAATYNVRHPGQCDGQSGYGVTKLDAIVESIVCTKFSEKF